MTFIIIAIIIAIILLSKNYIARLEPAGVFAAMWTLMFVAILLIQDYFVLRFDGILFLGGAVFVFLLGTCFCDTIYHPQPSETKLIFKREWAMPFMIVLLIGAMVKMLGNTAFTAIMATGDIKKYSVWVGGVEVNDYYLSKKDADNLAKEYKDDGYDDVVVRREVA